MTYEEAKSALDRYNVLGSVYGLDGITRLMNALGRPERQFSVIHVAGTNGKGSTVTTLATILSRCGYRTISYTSPEVSTYLDRFRVDGEPAKEEVFVQAFTNVEAACQDITKAGYPHPTIFEMELAISYLIGLAEGCEVMVQETGLGGRLDATNVVEHPKLVVFTAIGMDHMQFLGDTLEAIAMEKAGIIKQGVPVVAYDNGLAVNAIIKEAALAQAAPCRFASAEKCQVISRDLEGQTIVFADKRYHYPLIGTHQVRNFSLIMTAIEALRESGFTLPFEHVKEALDSVRWPGRFEVVCKRPVIILDGAHNPQAAHALADTVRTWFPDKKAHFLMHLFKDKDALGILEGIAPVCSRLTLTTIDTTRSADPAVLRKTAQLFIPNANINIENDFTKALIACVEQLAPEDILIICGSLSHLETSRRVLSQLERINIQW
ncbi:MAG: folylpolyglutamate synthase/dihydrofolate synthase family protein [Peptococcaceae bacterium]|nr:folylpolyglutamate synthase/dihydrofolate synthase family protein [Peptococcaceae bacterium]